ncbi:MAG: acyltransferase [Flavobacteriaceae bacterium]|jgi:peptidoglycan/LPS O-acetylase OafA/YrhL|nr:acyltransferase [Flavobacteriaceae bacterium]
MFGIFRTFLAVNVILLHIFNVPTLGNYSVFAFFILSGFLMTLVVNENYGYSISGFSKFWINRVLRLYPVYLIIIFITFLLLFFNQETLITEHPKLYLPTSFFNWLENIFIIYPNILPYREIPRLSPASWAITNELIFYLFISLGVSKNPKRTIIWLLLSVLYFVYAHYYKTPSHRYGAIPAASLPFAIGSITYWISFKIKDFKVSLSFVLSLIVLFVLNAMCSKYLPDIFNGTSGYINMVVSALLVFSLYKLKVNTFWKSIDNKIGAYSYPFYLGHYIIVIVYSFFTSYGVLQKGFKLELKVLPIYFTLLIVFVFLLVKVIDEPVNKLRNKIKGNEN